MHCDKSFIQTSDLKTHIKSYIGERPLQCIQCRKSSLKKSDLYTHLRSHTGEKNLTNVVSVIKLSQKIVFIPDMQQYTQEKNPIHSVLMRRLSPAKGTLILIWKHTQKRIYINVAYVNKNSQLKVIMTLENFKLHTEETPYQCNQCDKTFKLKKGLKRHLKN